MSVAPADAGRAAALLAALQEAGSASPRASVTSLEQLEGGWSRHSWTARVEDPAAGTDSAHDYVVRVRPQGALLDTSLRQEYDTYALLVDDPVPTPRVHGFVDDDASAFGGPYFAMDRLPGRSLNVWRPGDREVLQRSWDDGRGLAEDLVRDLAAIHAIDADRVAGQIPLRSFSETVDHWRGIYEEVRLVQDPVVDEAYAWVRSREPAPVAPRLVHADYRIGNCLIEDDRITGVLDWELSFVGDPRFDLGYMSLDYHAGKFAAPGSPLLNATAEREWFHARYTELTGVPVDQETVDTFSALGALMLFAILSTGIRVYADGGTDDIRFLWSRFALPALRQDLSHLMGWR